MTIRQSIKSKLTPVSVPVPIPVPVPVPEPPLTTTPTTEKPVERNKFLFITDSQLTSEIKTKFKQFNKTIIEFNYLTFQNKNINDLNVKLVWFNLTDVKSRDYLASNLKKNQSYKIVAVTSDKKAKWIQELDEYFDKTVKLSNMKTYLGMLCFNDFKSNLENNVEISEIPSKFMNVVGLLTNQQNKRRVLKIIKLMLTEDIPYHLIMILIMNSAPCLVGAIEILKQLKDCNDLKNILIEKINNIE